MNPKRHNHRYSSFSRFILRKTESRSSSLSAESSSDMEKCRMLLRLKLWVNSLNVAGGGGGCSASASDAWSLSSASAPSSDAACRWLALRWTDELFTHVVFTTPTFPPAPPTGPKLSNSFRICCNESLCRTILSNNWHFFPSSCMSVSRSCSFLWMQGSHFFPLTKFPDFSLTFPVFFSFFPDLFQIFFMAFIQYLFCYVWPPLTIG